MTKDPPAKDGYSQEASLQFLHVGSSDKEEVSQPEDPQLEGNPLLYGLLLLAEERQYYETFASPQNMGFLNREIPQQTKLQTPPWAQSQVNLQAAPQTAQSQVNPQTQPQMPQAQAQGIQAKPMAPRQPPISTRGQAQAAPPPVRRLVHNPLVVRRSNPRRKS